MTNYSLRVYRDAPQGMEIGDSGKYRQVWNRFTNRNFYFCPTCKGWIEGRIDNDPFKDPICLRCDRKV